MDTNGIRFPNHDVMQIIHNPHIMDGMDAEDWIEATSDRVVWKNKDQKEAIKNNSIWVAAWVSLDRPRDVKFVGSCRFEGLF